MHRQYFRHTGPVVPSHFYSSTREFEPLFPTRRGQELVDASREVAIRSLRLSGAVHPTTLESLRNLLREMNSYYSNRIEGQGTHPLEIAAALRQEFSNQPEVARLQRLAVAHIAADRTLEGPPSESALTMAYLRKAHAELYAQLAMADRQTKNQTEIVPGGFRTMRVQVGYHVPPEPHSLDSFAQRFDEVFGRRRSIDETVLAVAAAHHRASWIHPFEDGNGRAVRLQSHAALFQLSGGLWSANRGLARDADRYFAYLAAADAHRDNDRDGRGNLSDRALGEWCQWFINVCADQVAFMESMLRLDDVARRLHALIVSRSAFDQSYRVETIAPLHHLFACGPVSRGTFANMTGLGERTARNAMAHLLRVGFLTSADARGPVRIAFPLDSLALLFPELYPEAATSRVAG